LVPFPLKENSVTLTRVSVGFLNFFPTLEDEISITSAIEVRHAVACKDQTLISHKFHDRGQVAIVRRALVADASDLSHHWLLDFTAV
jgi:hypothetical protein